jgi:ABC-type sulfate/molybdate transport systems ATPase subunit
LLAILGPSGAGKTSVLDVASGGLLARATGSVCINGEPLALSNIAAQVWLGGRKGETDGVRT